MSRESTAAALLTQIDAPMRAAGAVTVSRRLKHWADVPAVNQPAVYISEGQSTPTQSKEGLPPVWSMMFNIYLYATETDQAASPATKLNLLLDALEGALAPTAPGTKQTLGGRVVHCWITGVETDEGILGDQCMAIVAVEALYA